MTTELIPKLSVIILKEVFKGHLSLVPADEEENS